MAARRFLPSLCGLAILFATSVAAADQGQIVLVGGKVLVGDIQQVAHGDYIVIRLDNGELRAVAWKDIVWFGYGGTAVTPDSGGGWTEQPPPPGPVYQPAPPTYVYAPPWAPPPPPPPPPPRMSFKPRLTLSARVGPMWVGGNVYGHDYDYNDYYHPHGPRLRMADVVGWGWMVEGDLGYHFSPSWTVYGFWEHGQFEHGDLNAGSGTGHTNAVGIGINANTHPFSAVGFYFDVGAAYRWMDFGEVIIGPNNDATLGGRASVEGFDFLRASVGVSINLGRHFRLDPNIFTSYGYFTRYHGNLCPGGCSLDGNGYDLGGHSIWGLAIKGNWDL